MRDLIQKLVECFGPVGYEDQVRSIIRDETRGLADQVSITKLGSLIAVKRGAGQGRKVMLVAHMDEIGLIVTHIDQRGYARVAPLGAVFPLYSVGSRVRFANGHIGVINVERRDDPLKTPTLEQIYIDLGAADKASCPVSIGDVACFHHGLESAGNRLIAKAMDDRLGCAILIETLRRLTLKGAREKTTPHEVYFVFSVQAETTSVGARTAAYLINPDIAIAVGVTPAGDTPRALPMSVDLGKGPAVKIRDTGMIADPRVKNWMVQRAREAKIPHQLEILRDGSTDAQVVQITREGVPSGGLMVPCRHVHSPSEMIDLADVDNAVKLLIALLKQPIALQF